MRFQKLLAIIVILFGSTGAFAAVSLIINKLAVLKNPDTVLSCDIDLWFNCGQVMESKWGYLLGHPNYIFGLILYSLAIMTGLFMLGNEKNGKPIMWFAMLLSGFGLFININLLYISIFLIVSICLWCVLSIISTANVFFAILHYNYLQGHLSKSKRIKQYFEKYHIITVITFNIFIFMLVFGMRYVFREFPELMDVSWPDPIFWLWDQPAVRS